MSRLPKLKTDPQACTVEEACRLLGCSGDTVRRDEELCSNGPSGFVVSREAVLRKRALLLARMDAQERDAHLPEIERLSREIELNLAVRRADLEARKKSVDAKRKALDAEEAEINARLVELAIQEGRVHPTSPDSLSGHHPSARGTSPTFISDRR